MLRTIGCITEQHDIPLVLLAATVCFVSCFTTLGLLARARLRQTTHWSWLIASSVVAGVGVWSTHFIAMLAYRTPFTVGYEVGLTALSIAIAVLASFAAFYVATRTQRWWLGGAMFGAAVAAMHFTGMAAMQAPADFVWDYSYVAASIAFGAACGALGLWSFARSPGTPWHLAGTLGLTVAIAGLHFTAMSALTLSPNPLAAPTMTLVMAPNWFAFAIAAAMLLVVALGLSGSAFDRLLVQRATLEAARLRMYVDELEMTKGELQRSNKNLEIALTAAAAGSQAKSQFLATMSHELRTPLNAIIGFSEIIDNESLGPLGNPRYKDYVKDILASGRHLLKLVNEVLDFSKVDSGRLELDDDIVDIGDLIRSTTRMIRTQAEQAEVDLRANVAGNLPLLRADERRLRQVLINLLSNAVKFTQPGGDVTISANVGVGGVTFCIDDTGIGMAPEQIPIALERFGQVTSDLARQYDGAGLGLPLAKKLTELHGGTLTIESALDVGTRITVTLPWTRAVPDQATEERAALIA